MRILITGFGPYHELKENASWEGVKTMKKEEIEKLGVSLLVEQVPVDYKEVDTKISGLWEKHKQFDLAIHVGVDVTKDFQCLTLEKQACKGLYEEEDIKKSTPDGKLHPLQGMDIYSTALNLEAILEKYNQERRPEHSLTAEISEDAGKYLCEYIYYTSLHHSNSKKVLFVHVPDNLNSLKDLAVDLELLLKLVLEHC